MNRAKVIQDLDELLACEELPSKVDGGEFFDGVYYCLMGLIALKLMDIDAAKETLIVGEAGPADLWGIFSKRYGEGSLLNLATDFDRIINENVGLTIPAIQSARAALVRGEI